jgi:hypothetical protein
MARAHDPAAMTNQYGDLHDYMTGIYLRPATEAELAESVASGFEGAFRYAGDPITIVHDCGLTAVEFGPVEGVDTSDMTSDDYAVLPVEVVYVAGGA